jgi:hypothetical protein
MAYRLTWTATVSWVGPGQGPIPDPGNPRATGNGASKGFAASAPLIAIGQGANGGINAADITALVAGMSADLTAQLNANPALFNMARWPLGHGA